MLLVLYGNSELFAHLNKSYGEKYFKFDDPVDVNKYIKQVKLPISLHTCA